jgi:hypothetical protein
MGGRLCPVHRLRAVRSIAKLGASKHDMMRGFITQLFTIYLAAGVVIALLFVAAAPLLYALLGYRLS